MTDLSRPTMAGLSYVLRNRSLWPHTFVRWHWGYHETCAMGLAQQLWPSYFPRAGKVISRDMAEVFGLSITQAEAIFIGVANGSTGTERVYDLNKGPITPEMVADVIDHLLAIKAA